MSELAPSTSATNVVAEHPWIITNRAEITAVGNSMAPIIVKALFPPPIRASIAEAQFPPKTLRDRFKQQYLELLSNVSDGSQLAELLLAVIDPALGISPTVLADGQLIAEVVQAAGNGHASTVLAQTYDLMHFVVSAGENPQNAGFMHDLGPAHLSGMDPSERAKIEKTIGHLSPAFVAAMSHPDASGHFERIMGNALLRTVFVGQVGVLLVAAHGLKNEEQAFADADQRMVSGYTMASRAGRGVVDIENARTPVSWASLVEGAKLVLQGASGTDIRNAGNDLTLIVNGLQTIFQGVPMRQIVAVAEATLADQAGLAGRGGSQVLSTAASRLAYSTGVRTQTQIYQLALKRAKREAILMGGIAVATEAVERDSLNGRSDRTWNVLLLSMITPLLIRLALEQLQQAGIALNPADQFEQVKQLFIDLGEELKAAGEDPSRRLETVTNLLVDNGRCGASGEYVDTAIPAIAI